MATKNQHVIAVILISVAVLLNYFTPVLTFNSSRNNNSRVHHRRHSHAHRRSQQSDLLLEKNETYSHHQEDQNIIVKENSESVIGNVNPGCRSCMLNRQLESTLPTNTLRKMRLELIKEQILRKLGLKEPPSTSYVVTEPLPEPVVQGNIQPKGRRYHSRHGVEDFYGKRVSSQDVEDFYGKTEQVIIFPEEVLTSGCTPHPISPSACVSFTLPQENHVDEIGSAELWAYKLPDENIGNQSLWAHEISQTDVNHRAKFVDAQYHDSKEGWIKFNLTKVIPRWLKAGILQQTMQIGCKTCSMKALESPIITLGEQRPFIVITYRSKVQKKRSRRNINCLANVEECCRETFIVSFSEIGWDHWIVAPAEYNAYFCKGSCGTINAMSRSASRHTTVMQNYVNIFGLRNRTAQMIVPCCSPARMSAISLIYRDPNYFNTTLKSEILPNMVVESCNCL